MIEGKCSIYAASIIAQQRMTLSDLESLNGRFRIARYLCGSWTFCFKSNYFQA